MCKVYDFPTQKHLPEEITNKLEQHVEEYIEIMTEVIQAVDNISETLNEYNALMGEVVVFYAETLQKAVEKM